MEDADSEPLVLDWRAPMAVPFYRAGSSDNCGLVRRRQIVTDRGRVVSLADDLFGVDQTDGAGGPYGSATRLRGGDALLAELERGRTGEMLDIVATIQAEQDVVIRAPLDRLMAVQGGPGTGKTAVGLHRAAFLLYNHPDLAQRGVLLLGPSRAFLRYVAQVLPSLGEEAVVQTTVAGLAPRVRVTREDPLPVRRLKGDPRMADLIVRSLATSRERLVDDVTLRAKMATAVMEAERVNRLVEAIAASGGPYRAGRGALRSRLAAEFRTALREGGRLEANDPALERELVTSDGFRNLLDRLWPSASAPALVRNLLGRPDRLAAAAALLMVGLIVPSVRAPRPRPWLEAGMTSDASTRTA